MSRMIVENAEIKNAKIKQLKFEANFANLTILQTNSCIGVWLQSPSPGFDSVCMVYLEGQSPHIQLWAPKEYGAKLPFAFGGNGLQIPMPNSSDVVIFSLEEIAAFAKQIHDRQQ